MASVEEAVIQRLLDTSALTSLVDERVFPLSVPQKQPMPAVVVAKISGSPEYSDDGEDGVENARIQVDCWGSSYPEAKEVSREVRGSLSAFIGLSYGIEILYLQLDVERDLRESGSNQSEYRFRVSTDYLVLYRS